MAGENPVRLGVNLDHLVTIRQARHTDYPDLAEAIRIVEASGGDGITMHLREDRRHIQPEDVYRSREVIDTTLNLEMAPTDEMVVVARAVRPDFCCLVPERREELTTEGGLDVKGQLERLRGVCPALAEAGIEVSLFVEPDPATLDAARETGASMVELHTGTYANARGRDEARELERLVRAAEYADALGLRVNAGHGLHYTNTLPVAAIPQINELNIGHSIIARALIVGLGAATREMKGLLESARQRV